MKRVCFFLFPAFLFMGISLVFSTDPLESLIEENQDLFTPVEEELPPAFLFGDQTGIELYSVAAAAGKPNLLCQPMELDEWIELSRGHLTNSRMELNLSIPRVRQAMEEACLVRLGDSVMALGAGWQKLVTVSGFFVQRDAALCPSDPPYALWARFEENLENPPLLYSTDSTLSEGENQFREKEQLLNITPTGDRKKQLQKIVPFFEDYDVNVASIGAVNCETLIFLKRRLVSSVDNGLPNQIMLGYWQDEIHLLWEEKVDIQKGSGRFDIRGTWDINNDGYVDLLITGEHQKCLYQVLFLGQEKGFLQQDLPNRPCGC